jgi:hypothetical protein
MRRLLLAFLVLFPSAAGAQIMPQTNGAYLGSTATTPRVAVALGYCQLSISTVVAISTCSGGIPANTRYALITPETAAIRCRDDGTNPTTAVGFPVAVAGLLTYSASDGVNAPLAALKCVAQTGTSTVDIWFYN